MGTQLSETCKMIKVEHSIFALPFVLVAEFFAANTWPPLGVTMLSIVAVIFARSAAMAFNRYLDADIDGLNVRTANRSIPAGRLSKSYALKFTIMNALLFVAICAMINFQTFVLSPIILVVLLGYSFTKRFTKYCHLVLGLALGLAPIGAWIAVTGSISAEPLLVSLGVLCWVAGFDIIYACQDIEFDRASGLNSIPARVGAKNALYIAAFLHIGMILALYAVGGYHEFGSLYPLTIMIIAACLLFEHLLVWRDLENIPAAFFYVNSSISLVYATGAIASLFVR